MTTPQKGRPDPRRREPLWDRVDRNRVLLAAYVTAFVVSFVVVFDTLFMLFGGCLVIFAFARLGWPGTEPPAFAPLLIWGPSAAFAALALAWSLFSLSRSEKWLLTRLGAEFVPKGELLDTKLAVKDMAIAAGLPVAPALYVMDTTNVNALVLAPRRRRAVLGVTRGLVEKLSVEQQRAVFAHLIARLVNGDVIVDTGVTALLWPLHMWRDRQIRGQNDRMNEELLGTPRTEQSGGEMLLAVLVFGIAFAIVGEFFAFGHRHKQLRDAEKADAEGMLLLKDPRAMLSALERCVELDNHVPLSGDAFADLFYCWTGESSNDEDDPEWERVARLREVLGVEGHVPDDSPDDTLLGPPPPPRLAQ